MASTEGCWAKARRRLYGSVMNWLELAYIPEVIYRETGRIRHDPQVENARVAYSKCMRRSGELVERPTEALHLARARFGRTRLRGDAPTRPERVMATSDADCQVSAGYQRALAGAVFRAARTWIRGHERDLLRLVDIQRMAVGRAQTVLAYS